MKISAALSKEAFLQKMEGLTRAITQQENPQPINNESFGIRTGIWTTPNLYHEEKKFFTTDVIVTPYYDLGGSFLLGVKNTEGNLFADEPLLEDVCSLMILRIPDRPNEEKDGDPKIIASAIFWNNPSSNFLVREIVLGGTHSIDTIQNFENIAVRVRHFISEVTQLEA